MEARNRAVKEWLMKVKASEILLPRFQRYKAWSSNIVTDFLTAVARDLPTGSTLVLEVGGELPFVSRAIKGAPRDVKRVRELLLDEQQRLTALWRSLTDNYPDKTYLVALKDGDKEGAEVIAISR
ncbi:MAG: DUF262 domain-containing protein [bacterium]